MSDPVRFLDDPSSPLASRAIEAWSGERPTEEARARALALTSLVAAATTVAVAETAATGAGVGGTGGAGTAATGGAATGGAVTTSSAVGAGVVGATKAAGAVALISGGVAKWLVVALVAAGIAGSSVVVYQQSTSPRAPLAEPLSPPSASYASRSPLPSVPSAAPSVAWPPSSVEDPPAPPKPQAPEVGITPDELPAAPLSVAPLAARARAAPSVDPVATELAQLDDARAAVRRGDGARALAMLDAFEAAHPQSPLGDEAVVVRVDALLHIGDRETAAAVARAFVVKRPASPYAARLDKIARSSTGP